MTIWDEAEDALCIEADNCRHCTSVRAALARGRKLEEALRDCLSLLESYEGSDINSEGQLTVQIQESRAALAPDGERAI